MPLPAPVSMRMLISAVALVTTLCLEQAPQRSVSPMALLHQGAARSQAVLDQSTLEARHGQDSFGKVSSHTHASAQGVFGDTAPRNPKPKGHMLTDFELDPIDNVACLQAKQRDPAINCSDVPKSAAFGWSGSGQLNAGNYPSWKDPICNSDGENYFCDPENLLSAKDRKELLAVMKKQRESRPVTCGPQVQHDVVDQWNYRPFYLGVAIAQDFPLHEADPQSLQEFGRILAGRWNMTFPWDGNPAFYARCPNEAMLIILPKHNQAFLSSPSCMFLCPEKGGPEVTAATLSMLGTGSLLAGAKAGVEEVYRVLKETSPAHPPGWKPSEGTAGTWGGMPYGSGGYYQGSSSAKSWSTASAWVWNLLQRFIFGIAIVLLVGSVVMAFLVCYMAPGMNKELNKSVV